MIQTTKTYSLPAEFRRTMAPYGYNQVDNAIRFIVNGPSKAEIEMCIIDFVRYTFHRKVDDIIYSGKDKQDKVIGGDFTEIEIELKQQIKEISHEVVTIMEGYCDVSEQDYNEYKRKMVDVREEYEQLVSKLRSEGSQIIDPMRNLKKSGDDNGCIVNPDDIELSLWQKLVGLPLTGFKYVGQQLEDSLQVEDPVIFRA